MPLPMAEQRQLLTPYGLAVGASYAWDGGQYCAIHTARGVVGCGVYDIACANAFQMAFAIARGTPEHPLRQPEDLYAARIVDVSTAAESLGIRTGMTGMQALEMLLADEAAGSSHHPPLRRQPLRGIVPPLVTPLLDRDTIDEAGTCRLIDHVIAGGVAGIFVLGTTGEAPSLSYRLRREFIRIATRAAAGRVPVFVGITDTAFVESIALADVAAEAGADAVVLTTPYYFPAGQTELLQYVEHVVEQLPLPLMLYNMPDLTKVWFEIETVRQLTQFDGIIGVKDSSGKLDYFRQLVQLKQLRPDWTVLIGPEHLTAEAIAAGGDGGVNGGANIDPQLFVELSRAAFQQDATALTQLQASVDALQAIYAVGKYGSRFIKATKCALSLKGICSDRMAEPFNHFLPPEREQVQQILNAFDSQRQGVLKTQ